VVDQLFARYFEQGQDISDRTVLLDAAEAAGLERAVITRLLDSDADRDELAAEDAAAREMGVTGVPCFVIAGQHVVQGAQDSATWRAILAQLAALDADARGAAGDHDADDPRHADRSAP
jgi:predicted DsbA family dithiol-disulfide isomerase